MLSTRTNFHHSILPKLGAIGFIIMRYNRFNEPCYAHGTKVKYQCIAYPLCDNVLPYSKGIHTAFFKNLANNKIEQFSGFYFCEA